jgi:peroxiredoxin
MFSLSAQSPRKDSGADGLNHIKPLKIGDTIPESLWETPLNVANHSSGKNQITLNEYRAKKLIILDFWATWCAGCRYALKEINTVGEEIAAANALFLPVTYQSLKETKTARKQLNLKFQQVHDDKVLSQYFIHTALPHTIVIKDGRFYGIMKYAGEHTVSEIRNLLRGKKVRWKYNTNLIDTNKLIFSVDNGLGKLLYEENGLSLIVADSTFIDEPLNMIKRDGKYYFYTNSHSIRSLIYMLYKDELDTQPVMTFSNTIVYSDISIKNRLSDMSKLKLGMLFESGRQNTEAMKIAFRQMLCKMYGIDVQFGNWPSEYDPEGTYRKLMIKAVEKGGCHATN